MEMTYPLAAMERAMKIQEVIMRAMDKQISWLQAAEIIGVSARSMRRWRQRYQDKGYDGLYDHRLGRPSPKRVPVETVERVLSLYRKKYHDFNVSHACSSARRRLPRCPLGAAPRSELRSPGFAH
jgi:transposase